MILYFLRHGLAGDRMEWVGDDSLRPLTAEGLKITEQSADVIVKLDLGLELILTSPLTRAFQTGEIVAKRLRMMEKFIVDARLSPGFGVRELKDILQENKGCQNLMFVGHEPDFSMTVSDLIGGGQIAFKKGGLARVDLAGATLSGGELVWLIPPRVLRA